VKSPRHQDAATEAGANAPVRSPSVVYGARVPTAALQVISACLARDRLAKATMSPSLGGSVGEPVRCTFDQREKPVNPTTKVSLGESGAPYCPRRPSTVAAIDSSALPSPTTCRRRVSSHPTNGISDAPEPPVGKRA